MSSSLNSILSAGALPGSMSSQGRTIQTLHATPGEVELVAFRGRGPSGIQGMLIFFLAV